MSKRAPVAAPAPRVIHYIDPAPRADVVPYHPAELAARRREQQLQYARWVLRQEAIAERDRKVRHFLVGLGATIGVGVLAARCSAWSSTTP